MATDNGELGTGTPNRDPITGEPGSHPVGTGVGATGGALAGAAAGSLAGPAGTVAGMLIGAVVGGMGGKAVAERVGAATRHVGAFLGASPPGNPGCVGARGRDLLRQAGER